MRLEEKKELFIELLRASAANSSGEKVTLSESVLRENGLGDDTFWDVICPSLMEDGVLKDFGGNPKVFFSTFGQSVSEDPEVQNLSRRIEALNERHSNWPRGLYNPRYGSSDAAIEAEIKKYQERIEEIRQARLKNYRHVFTLNQDKLLESSGRTTLYFSRQKGITDNDGHSYRIAGKRASLLEALWNLAPDASISGAELETELSWDSSLLSASVAAINKVFSTQFANSHDLIQNGSDGYYLNRENFDFQTR